MLRALCCLARKMGILKTLKLYGGGTLKPESVLFDTPLIMLSSGGLIGVLSASLSERSEFTCAANQTEQRKVA